MKIEKTTILIFVAVTFIFGLLTNANANLIANGSFETGPNTEPLGVYYVVGGSTEINDWKVTRGGIDYKSNTYWTASDGNESLDLDNSAGFGGIEQEFTTAPGTIYLVAFDMAGNPHLGLGDPAMKHMGVSAAADYAEYSFDVTGYNEGNMGWITKYFQFTATSTSTTLEFFTLHSIEGGQYPGYTGWCGPALDNVSISIIPEPATLSLLGLGALSLLRKRKK